MNTTIDTIIFDVGGVLLPNYNDYIKKDISRALDVDLIDVNNAWNKLIPEYLGKGKISETEFWTEFRRLTKCQKEVETEGLLIREMENRYAPFASVSDVVKSLSADGYKLGIISDTIKAHVECHARHGLFDNFLAKVFSCEVGLRKLDPKIFQIALQQLNSMPENTIFIDDDPDIIRAVEKLGINGVIFKNDNQLKNDLENLGISIKVVSEKKPKIQGAYALILTKERNVLLQQRNVNPNIENSGKLAMFGGALDDGEDLLTGLKRELLEELELNIDEYKIEKLNSYAKTKELDGIDHLVNVWIVYDVDFNELKIHEGESIFSCNPKEIINNSRLTRVTNLALQDLIIKQTNKEF